MPLCASVYLCLAVTCWERAGLLALVSGVVLWLCHFPIGILGQVWWYLFVSIPDLCTFTYLDHDFHSDVIIMSVQSNNLRYDVSFDLKTSSLI